ncbi:MAG TPA: hypothetical protein VGJ81_06875 [Thermoanaerobaculia bacterium]|jgi:hypothetical protein
MSKQLSMIAALLIVLAAGCKNQQTASNDTATPAGTTTSASSASSVSNPVQASALSPEDLGTLGAQIKKQPNDADKLLSERGLNEQSFAAAIRKVSEDPSSAKRYTAAYKKAS